MYYVYIRCCMRSYENRNHKVRRTLCNEVEKGRREKKEVEAHKSGKNESLLVKSKESLLGW